MSIYDSTASYYGLMNPNVSMRDKVLGYLKSNVFDFGINTLQAFVLSRYGKEYKFSVTGGVMTERIETFMSKRCNIKEFKLKSGVKFFEHMYKLDKNTFLWISYGQLGRPSILGIPNLKMSKFMAMDIGRNSNNNNNDREITAGNIYVFGKNAKRYIKELDSIFEASTDQLYLYSVSGNKSYGAKPNNEDNYYGGGNSGGLQMQIISSILKTRNIDTLFYDNEVKETVMDHIDRFGMSESMYTEKDLPFKTGILLTGYPGTGKSSLVNALATYYHFHVVQIDMQSFAGLDVLQLTQTIDADNERYIILMEDIDTLFNTLDRTDEKIDKEEKRIVNQMLQFLDSPTLSPSNVIFIATTNHPEMLDTALTRSGRFDLIQEVGPICKETVVKMCKSFELNDDNIKEIISGIKQFPVNQSSLQGDILRHIKINTLSTGSKYKVENNDLDLLKFKEKFNNLKFTYDKETKTVTVTDKVMDKVTETHGFSEFILNAKLNKDFLKGLSRYADIDAAMGETFYGLYDLAELKINENLDPDVYEVILATVANPPAAPEEEKSKSTVKREAVQEETKEEVAKPAAKPRTRKPKVAEEAKAEEPKEEPAKPAKAKAKKPEAVSEKATKTMVLKDNVGVAESVAYKATTEESAE